MSIKLCCRRRRRRGRRGDPGHRTSEYTHTSEEDTHTRTHAWLRQTRQEEGWRTSEAVASSKSSLSYVGSCVSMPQ